MKKRIFIMFFVLIMVFAFSSCSAKGRQGNSEPSMDSNEGSSIEPQVSINQTNRKIIYTVGVNISTDNFDNTLTKLYTAVNEDIDAGNWIKSSDINEYSSYKIANLIIRIKTTKLNEFLAKLPEMGKISAQSQSSQDITYSYAQAEAMITALNEEKDYISNLLEEDFLKTNPELALQYINKITNINTQIALISDELIKYDNDLEYSTVNVTIKQYTDGTENSEKPFGTRIKNAFKNSMNLVQMALKGLFIVLIYIFPFALIIGAVSVFVYFINKKVIARKRGKEYIKKVKEDMNKDKK